MFVLIRKLLSKGFCCIELLTHHAHRRQNIPLSPQDRLAYPIQHLLRYSKAAPGQGEMQMPPRYNSSAHQLEYPIALVLREVGAMSFHSEFELCSPDGKHARVAQLTLSYLPIFLMQYPISLFFKKLAKWKIPWKAFLMPVRVAYFSIIAVYVFEFSDEIVKTCVVFVRIVLLTNRNSEAGGRHSALAFLFQTNQSSCGLGVEVWW